MPGGAGLGDDSQVNIFEPVQVLARWGSSCGQTHRQIDRQTALKILQPFRWPVLILVMQRT